MGGWRRSRTLDAQTWPSDNLRDFARGRLEGCPRRSRFAVLTVRRAPGVGIDWSDTDSLFAGLHSLQGAVQEVRNAKRFGAATKIVVIERLPLDEENAEHVSPLSI